jgi:hypothetical protein
MPKGHFNSIEARERHKMASSRGGRARVKKGFAISGDPREAGRRSGAARRAVGKEDSILARLQQEKAG